MCIYFCMKNKIDYNITKHRINRIYCNFKSIQFQTRFFIIPRKRNPSGQRPWMRSEKKKIYYERVRVTKFFFLK